MPNPSHTLHDRLFFVFCLFRPYLLFFLDGLSLRRLLLSFGSFIITVT
jgi:hypothetical protein